MLSVAVIFILWWFLRERVSYITLGIGGAVGHNLAQLAVACAILQSGYLFMFYLPVLLAAGVLTGTVTGFSLKAVMPAFNRIHGGW
jgi:heptaprenyl diphosphate synthase